MNKYEVALIISPVLSDEEKNAVVENVKGYIERRGGTVTNVDDSKLTEILGEDGNDTITVNNSYNTKTWSGSGDDSITISGGSQHAVELGSGTNTINIAAKNVTISESSGNAKDKITVAWSDNIGNLTINSASYSNDPRYTDELTITGFTLSDSITF